MNTSGDVDSPLPDLTHIDLSSLLLNGDSVLRSALQRVREQAASGEQVVAGFNSAV
jgi:FXSXX-COOH protein